ncbi:unnamed protein product [Lupinus luteus]|uniref:Uncharacterized protein n=1 Tax=Lupinus luteus TaxID=3873 RepID=A0AAV1VTW6_LUPLU
MAHVSDSIGESQQEHLVLDSSASKSEVELKKKRLLEELESVIPSFGIEMIDETALVGSTFPLAKKTNKQSRKKVGRGGAGGKMKKENLIVMKNAVVSAAAAVAVAAKYSRKEMEALRFVNVGQQRKFWKSIYKCLQSHDVAKEYDTLVAPHNSPQCLLNKKPILGVSAANGRWRIVNVLVH